MGDADAIKSPRLSQCIPMEHHRRPGVQHGLTSFIPWSNDSDEIDDVPVVDDTPLHTHSKPGHLDCSHGSNNDNTNLPQLTWFAPAAHSTSKNGPRSADSSRPSL